MFLCTLHEDQAVIPFDQQPIYWYTNKLLGTCHLLYFFVRCCDIGCTRVFFKSTNTPRYRYNLPAITPLHSQHAHLSFIQVTINVAGDSTSRRVLKLSWRYRRHCLNSSSGRESHIIMYSFIFQSFQPIMQLFGRGRRRCVSTFMQGNLYVPLMPNCNFYCCPTQLGLFIHSGYILSSVCADSISCLIVDFSNNSLVVAVLYIASFIDVSYYFLRIVDSAASLLIPWLLGKEVFCCTLLGSHGGPNHNLTLFGHILLCVPFLVTQMVRIITSPSSQVVWVKFHRYINIVLSLNEDSTSTDVRSHLNDSSLKKFYPKYS